MAQKIGAHDTEFVLRQIPGKLGERRRQDQRRDLWWRLVGEHTPLLQAMRGEIVGITTTPRGLRLRAARDLTRRGRTRTLATANAVVRHKPSATDAAGPLREHPQMLASTTENQSGLLLASNPGSILASAEGANGYEHESGTIKGHNQQYRSKLAEPAVNFATWAEPRIGSVWGGYGAFLSFISSQLNDRRTQINNAASVEACNSDWIHDVNCNPSGLINYPPYQPPCQ